jgi:hypothetical protein
LELRATVWATVGISRTEQKKKSAKICRLWHIGPTIAQSAKVGKLDAKS